jgi:uncharacterized membrane protein YphA (DoxX/SURF4 family)
VRKRELLPWVGLAVRLTAAAIWLFAGITKLSDLVEVAIGAYLLVGAMVRPTAILACVLMVIFLVAEAQAWARGLSIDCGCFGTTVQTQVGAATILRDIALGVPSALMAWRPARKLSVDASLLGREDAFGPAQARA